MAKQKYLSLSFVPTEDNGYEQENTLTVRFSAGGFEGLAHFHGEGASLTASGDALFCLGLVPAMELGVDLRIEADVDRELMENAAVIQDRLCSWYPGYRPVRVEAETTQRTYPANRGTGLFYSGGVDSSFSLATESDRITGLVTIIGFGVESVDAKRAERLKKINREVASKYGMKSIAVTTDIRRVSDRLVGWYEFHGAALAAVRHLLAHEFENQLIASSADESSWNRRWGSHPGLDSLWGTEGARLEHHGLVDRLSKIDRIIDEPLLMQHLRVCNRRFEHCGKCHSCQFMLAAFDVLGARDKAPTYSHIAPGPVSLRVTGEGSLSDLTKMRAAALKSGSHGDIVAAIDHALSRYRYRKGFQRLLPVDEAARRFKRLKHKRRFDRAVRGSG